ncbi:MAG: hypothetical protein AAFW75_19160 [Cyanobacteria bacterium J06636_16]
MWFEIAVISNIFAIGNILFGHFEAGIPKWKRTAKYFLSLGISVLISGIAGRFWFFAFLGTFLMFPLIIHVWWLPRKGINGWTGEPKDKYYELRGWKQAEN